MTAPHPRKVRDRLKLTQAQMATALGYTGTNVVMAQIVSKYERGVREMPPAVRLLANMYFKHGLPPALKPRAAKAKKKPRKRR